MFRSSTMQNKFIVCFYTIAMLLLAPLADAKDNKIKYQEHWNEIIALDKDYPEVIAEKISESAAMNNPYELLPFIRATAPTFSKVKPRADRTKLLQQNTKDLTALRKEAEDTQKRLRDFLESEAKKYPNSKVMVPETKGMETIDRLLKTRWNGDASMITDYSRGTISFDKMEELDKFLNQLKQSGLIILTITDQFKQPTDAGYRDYNIVFRDFSNGHLGEVQLNLNPILDVKNAEGHHLFDIIRKTRALSKTENRPLTDAEQETIDKALSDSNQLYDAGFAKALELKSSQVNANLFIQNDQNEVLLVEQDKDGKKMYTLPRAQVQIGESLPTALRKQIRMLMNKDASIGKSLYVSRFVQADLNSPHIQQISVYYELKNPKGLISECMSNDKCNSPNLKWVNPKSMPKDKMLSDDLEFLEQANIGVKPAQSFDN